MTFSRLSLPILFWTALSSACFARNDYARAEGYPVFDRGDGSFALLHPMQRQ